MPGRTRTQKQLAQRIDRSYFKRLFPIPLWRRILTVAFVGIGLGWLGIDAIGRNQAPYSSGPLTTAHAFLGKDCATCHGATMGVAKKVTGAACMNCHDAPAHSAVQTRTPACVECHVEHEGDRRLAVANNRACTDCHSDLKTKSGAPTVAASISSFTNGHPEFAALHSKTADTGGIKFNHQIHIAASMTCNVCHSLSGMNGPPETHGRAYMQRVTYQDQCAGCHALNFDDAIPDVAPHDKPEVVDAFVKQKVTAYAATHPLPGGAAAKIKTDEQNLWTVTCARCHEMGMADANGFPTVAPTHVNARVFKHAEFDHGAHQELECASCHPGAANSASASDQLIPGIAVCQSCHNGGSRSASADCSTCHLYHDWSKGKPVDGKFTIKNLTSSSM